MKTYKKIIGIIVYANPDDYPPIINAVAILNREFNIVVICRNQGKAQIAYPAHVKLYRLGKLKSARERERQGLAAKILEYITFTLRAIFYIRLYHCQLIYSYDMHGFVVGFLAGRFGRRIPLIYHNHDLVELDKIKGLTCIIKYFELRLAPYADRIIFPDINRARFFKKEAKLTKLPDIVMNTPLPIEQIPGNRLKEVLEAKGFNVNAKVILYQGAIGRGHSILEILKSMVFWPENTVLALSGYAAEDFMEGFYKEANALKVIDRIIYLPFVPYVKISSYTVGAYIGLALFNSQDINRIFNAGASNKIFEYLSMGIPVITNDSPYFREILDASLAYFAKAESVEDIARVINRVFLDQEEYLKKSQAARKAHLTKFNYEEQFKSTLEYIQEIVE